MGITAENLVEQYGISREEQDYICCKLTTKKQYVHSKMVNLIVK